ncbi:hypothetical protein MRB53_010786 [Persea americana]|uniref:Uncharacterized protein n=1 Tax=Persea americana TaxID=3435 RepID=A0ACC2LSW3_PERAE|nr:hypothetical protein MRB53_010786 [Persea americana]
MGRSHRSRTPSRSPPPRRKRYDDSRDSRDTHRGGPTSFRDQRRSSPSSLLVRNIPHDARPEDLRIPFERFGPVKDVYLPKNYYTGEPRGFGFVKFRNAEDAADAKQQLNHQVIGGREIAIVYADENRKTPQEMRVSGRVSGRNGGGSYRRRSPPRSPRRRIRSYSRSPSPRRNSRAKDRGARYDSHSPSRSLSLSPRDDKDCRSPRKSLSPRKNSRRSLSPREDSRRSLSPREDSRRSLSLRQNSRRSLSPERRNRRSLSPTWNSRRSLSPRENNRMSSSPREDGRSRSYSPR